VRARWLPVTIWVFFALSSLTGAIGGLFATVAAAPQPGPGGPLEGVVYGMALVVTGLSAIVFTLCLFLRPPAKDFTPRNWIIAIGSCAILFIGFRLATHSGRYNLSIQIVDPQGHPIPKVSVEYTSYPLGEGIGRLDHIASGVTSTDSSGTITLRTNHAHTVSVQMRRDGFQTTSFHLEAAGHGYPHQIVSSVVDVLVPAGIVPGRDGWLFPRDGDVRLRVTLPFISSDG